MKLSPPDSGARLTSDVCVIGAGAAGITIARALGRAGVDTLLLEAGGRTPAADADVPYRGRSVATYGEHVPDAYVHQSRLRWFGGSTNHWAGWCHPLDAEDLAARPGVPDSGWPIAFDDLAPWYTPASAILDFAPFTGSTRPKVPARARLPLPEDGDFAHRVFRRSPPVRFGAAFGPELDASPSVRVVTDAAVQAIRCDVQRVTHLEVLGARGPWTVRARRYVLACGGIENARLLLASDQDRPGGVGNEHDLVGRYFSDHPELKPAARLVFTPPAGTRFTPWMDWLSTTHGEVHLFLDATPALRAREGLLRFSAELRPLRAPTDPAESAFATAIGGLAGLDGTAREVRVVEVVGRPEVAPNRESRVTLGEERDPNGMRRVVVDWRLGEAEARTVRVGMAALGRTLGASGLGVLALPEGDPWRALVPGCHHLGTTRMGADPTRGVVDARCRVHSAPNLYVGGSSVFATTGVVNPTFTIVALALRIADDLVRGAP